LASGGSFSVIGVRVRFSLISGLRGQSPLLRFMQLHWRAFSVSVIKAAGSGGELGRRLHISAILESKNINHCIVRQRKCLYEFEILALFSSFSRVFCLEITPVLRVTLPQIMDRLDTTFSDSGKVMKPTRLMAMALVLS